MSEQDVDYYIEDLTFIGLRKRPYAITIDAFSDTDQINFFDMLRILWQGLQMLIEGVAHYFIYPLAFSFDIFKAWLACYLFYKSGNRNSSEWIKTSIALIKCILIALAITNALIVTFLGVATTPILVMSCSLMRALYRLAFTMYHGVAACYHYLHHHDNEAQAHFFFFLHHARGFLLASTLATAVFIILILNIHSFFLPMEIASLALIAVNIFAGQSMNRWARKKGIAFDKAEKASLEYAPEVSEFLKNPSKIVSLEEKIPKQRNILHVSKWRHFARLNRKTQLQQLPVHERKKKLQAMIQTKFDNMKARLDSGSTWSCRELSFEKKCVFCHI